MTLQTLGSQLIGSKPSFDSTAVSSASAQTGSAFGTLNSGAFNVGGASLTPLLIIGAGALVLIILIKKKA